MPPDGSPALLETLLVNDPPAAFQAEREELLTAIARALDSGRFVLGPEVEAFEIDFARYLDVAEAVGTANGTRRPDPWP